MLAVIVVLPMPAKGVYYMLTPVAGDVTFQESVTSFEAHPGILEALTWFDAVFVVTLIPATIALAWVARRRAPRLTAAGAVIALTGFLVGMPLLGGALKRSRSVPAWVGLAVMIGGATHPFIPTHIGQGIGLFVAAAGFAGVSVALLRMTNDEFDLPAIARPSAQASAG